VQISYREILVRAKSKVAAQRRSKKQTNEKTRIATKSKRAFAGIGDEAVAAKTGRGWNDWFALLDKAGAAKWPHKDIAAYLHDIQYCPNWWSQMITVGYEQARGLRVKHQVADGFSASASKTISVPPLALFAAWANPKRRAKWLPDGDTIIVRKATPAKSIRITWTDGSNVDVGFFAKGESKAQVAVEQCKLKSLRDVARVKAYWAKTLENLKELLESADSAAGPKSPRRKV
jgi:hypothetical protein